VRELGGKVLVEPFEIPDGSLALVHDSEGVLVAIFAGEVDP
jgi:predicted enzyme related to lactoylglutathione lyase